MPETDWMSLQTPVESVILSLADRMTITALGSEDGADSRRGNGGEAEFQPG
jgi:hypothetical protein